MEFWINQWDSRNDSSSFWQLREPKELQAEKVIGRRRNTEVQALDRHWLWHYSDYMHHRNRKNCRWKEKKIIWSEYQPRKSAERKHLKSQQNIILPRKQATCRSLDSIQSESAMKYNNKHTVEYSKKHRFKYWHTLLIVRYENCHCRGQYWITGKTVCSLTIGKCSLVE